MAVSYEPPPFTNKWHWILSETEKREERKKEKKGKKIIEKSHILVFGFSFLFFSPSITVPYISSAFNHLDITFVLNLQIFMLSDSFLEATLEPQGGGNEIKQRVIPPHSARKAA